LHPKYETTPKLDHAMWNTLFDELGTHVPDALEKWKEARIRIFYGGIDKHSEQLRCEVWKYLLGYYTFEDDSCRTLEQRNKLDRERAALYQSVKQQWRSITPQQEKNFSLYRERKGRIDKDVVRTDRSIDIYKDQDGQSLNILRNILLTYGMWNFDLGYCQGMGDLLSPILHVIRDEAQSFWCFVCLMETPKALDTSFTYDENELFDMEKKRLEGNGPNIIHHMQCSGHFEMNSKYMEKQLNKLAQIAQLLDKDWYAYLEERGATNFFFCFRWILVLFKREFTFEDIKILWERVWSLGFNENNPQHKPCSISDFFLFMSYAVLRQHKQTMMKDHSNWEFDDILKFCVDLSQKINVEQALKDAETIYSMYCDNCTG
jgi:hypothetical protein